MRMAGVADVSVMIVMPSKPALQHPFSPLPTPTLDTHSDDVQATPDNSGPKRKRRSTDDGSTTDEEGDMSKTLYECRFCTMRFAKSQALGGHMNRHRQEREKEQYQHAQQLVSSMAQQQTSRTWNTMAAELNGSSGAGAVAQLARLSTQLTRGAPNSSRSDGSRPQLPPQVSFNSTRGLPITTTSSPTIPDASPPSNYYLPANSSSNNLQHLQWNVEGFNANRGTMPRSSSHPSLSVLDSMTGGMRDDFLSGVLHPRQDAVTFVGQAQYSSTMNVPPLNLRAEMSSAGPGSFQESLQGNSVSTGLQFAHDHQNFRMNDMLWQLACTSSPLNSNFMQSNVNPNDVKPPTKTVSGVRNSASSPTCMMQCNNIVQFKQPQCSLPGPRPLGNSTTGQYDHVLSPPSMLSGHSFNNGHAAPTFGSLLPGHEFNTLQEFENNMTGTQGQYHSVSRPAMGSAANGSFGMSGGHEPGMYGHVKMQSNEDGFNQLSVNQDHLGPGVDGVRQQNQINTPASVVHEVVDGNHCESMNITTVTESGDISALSAPARYQSTDFSSGSPESRNRNSPSAHTNHASPPSQEYCSG